MSLINTYNLAPFSQAGLQKSQASLGAGFERMSSRLRINSVPDDAAGLAISQRMAEQVKGISDSARNTNSAISLTQVAEGSLSSVTDNLQRMRTLAADAASGTLTDANRQKLQQELEQNSAEIDRIANGASFNGQKLLDGSFSGATFQVGGANSGNSIRIDALADTRAAALGSVTSAVATVAVDAASKARLQSDIATGSVDVTVTGANGKAVTTTINQDANVTADGARNKFIEAVNSTTAQTGVTAYLSNDSSSIEYRASLAPGQDASQMAIEATGSNVLAATAAAYTRQGVADLNITTQAGASEALQRIDAAIESVNKSRGSLGALQGQIDSSMLSMSSTVNNTNGRDIRSRIEDLNAAVELSNTTRNQMLLRPYWAVLSQANTLPQLAFSLLR